MTSEHTVTLVDRIDSEDEEKMKGGKIVNLSDLNGDGSYNFQIYSGVGRISSMVPKSTSDIESALNKLKQRRIEVKRVYVCPSSNNPSPNLEVRTGYNAYQLPSNSPPNLNLGPEA